MKRRPETKKDKSADSANKKFTISPVARFVILFLVLLLAISIGFSQLFTRYHDDVLWLMELTASISGNVLGLFSGEVSHNGVFVNYAGFSVEIIDECTGLFEMLIYLAAVLSFATTIRKKLLGVAFGLPAIFLFNVIRIIALLLAGAKSYPVFQFMHLYLWQVTLIIMIAAIWILWLYLVVYREKRPVAVSS
nr:exosortase H [candidate division Zixibacteria bacterium]